MPRPDPTLRPVPVLVFHSVSDRPGRSVWTVGATQFRRMLGAVAASGRTGVAFGALVDAMRRGDPIPDRPVCITFDDGFVDNIDALADCADHGLPATVFVTTDYLGQPGMLTPSDLRELAELPGAEVGSHTMSHRRLDELSRREIDRELRDSRARLEHELSRIVDTLAYPHGNYDGRVLRAAAAAGYRGAAAVRMASAHLGESPLAVARYIVTSATSDVALGRLLAGELPCAPHGERVITRGYRVARRARALVRPAAGTPPVP